MTKLTQAAKLAALFACSCALVPAAGCGLRPGSGRKLPEREPFIALERDFQDFERWTPVDLSSLPAASDEHAGIDAHEYINQLPPHGSKTFPVGTILVKTVTNAGSKKHEAESQKDNGATKAKGPDIFAMVKRGGGYNQSGAAGWEWVELRRRDDDSFGIVWRGLNPPAGGGYGADSEGACNGCHQTALKNDCVHATALALSKI